MARIAFDDADAAAFEATRHLTDVLDCSPPMARECAMATRLFSDDQLERLRSFPDISTEELIRYFTLT